MRLQATYPFPRQASGGQAMAQHDVLTMADEVAVLMAERLGGARRGARPDLATMLRRRGGALPRRQRRAARVLAKAQRQAATPKLARQMDTTAAARAHGDLVRYLRPLGKAARWQAGALNVAAAVMLGLLLIGAVAVWIMVRRGLV